MYLILVSSLLVCVLLYFYLTRTLDYWKSRNVPGPKPHAFFGNILESTLRRKNIGVVFKEIYDQFPDEKVVGVFRMTTPCLLLRDLDVIKNVLIKDFDCFSDRGVSFSENGLGNNLFHADTDKWRVLRNRFTPIFTSGKLKNMVHLLDQRGDMFVAHIQELISIKCEQEIHSLIQKYTMATISACAFGLDIDTMGEKTGFFKKLDNMIFSPSFIDELDMMYPGILKNLKMELLPKEVTDFFENLVSSVIRQRNGVPSNRKDFMDLILEMRQQRQIYGTKRNEDETQLAIELTDDIIAAQAFVFYAAGYETSATTMSLMMYELAKNQDVQKKVIDEIDEVLERYEGKVTFETINDLKYMGVVFEETLRMYPLVEPLQRNAQVDYHIPGTNVTVKKGQMVLVSGLGIQRDKKYFPEPLKFDPERFTSEKTSARHTCTFLPFGTGPRNCIGMRFAKLQSRMCLLKFFSKFRVEPTSSTPPVMDFAPKRFILAPKGGVPLKIIMRK